MRSGPSALQGSIRLGRLRLPRLIPPTFCQPWSLLRKALIRAAKPSYTAITFCLPRHPTPLEYLTLLHLSSVFSQICVKIPQKSCKFPHPHPTRRLLTQKCLRFFAPWAKVTDSAVSQVFRALDRCFTHV
jgi:hypothetical protein